MKRETDVRVIKRDGTTELFQVAKLRRCVALAMRSCHQDADLSDALAQSVALHLRQCENPSPPSSEYVFHCARTVLMHTGMKEAARELVAHHRQRTARRKRLRVVDGRRPESSDERWRKAAVARTLRERHGLSIATARILAGEVEARVFALDLAVVTRDLVSELILNELLAWGLVGGPEIALHAAESGGAPGDRRPYEET